MSQHTIWTETQLEKWRIRKAEAGEPPPWAAKMAAAMSAELARQAVDQSPWWVYPPGSAEPVCCVSSWQRAADHVREAERYAALPPEVREAMREGLL